MQEKRFERPLHEKITREEIERGIAEITPERLAEELGRHPFDMDMVVAKEFSRIFKYEFINVEPSRERKIGRISGYLEGNRQENEKQDSQSKALPVYYGKIWQTCAKSVQSQFEKVDKKRAKLGFENLPEYIIYIPVSADALDETLHLIDTFLEQKDEQGSPLPSHLFDFVIFVNAPKEKWDEERYAQFLQALNERKKDHNGVGITTVKKIFEEQEAWPGMGFIRKVGGDIALERSLKHLKSGGNPLLITADSDTTSFIGSISSQGEGEERKPTKGPDPFALARWRRKLHEDPFTFAITPHAEFRERYDLPYIFAVQRLNQIVRTLQGRFWGNAQEVASGFQMFRPYHYALAGGYDIKKRVGEDFVLLADMRDVLITQIVNIMKNSPERVRSLFASLSHAANTLLRDSERKRALAEKIFKGSEMTEEEIEKQYSLILREFTSTLEIASSDNTFLREYTNQIARKMIRVSRQGPRVEIKARRQVGLMREGKPTINGYVPDFLTYSYKQYEVPENTDEVLAYMQNISQWDLPSVKRQFANEAKSLFPLLVSRYAKQSALRLKHNIRRPPLLLDEEKGKETPDTWSFPRFMERTLHVYLTALYHWGVDYDLRIPIDEREGEGKGVYSPNAFLHVTSSNHGQTLTCAIEDNEGKEYIASKTRSVSEAPEKIRSLIEKYLGKQSQAQLQENVLNNWITKLPRLPVKYPQVLTQRAIRLFEPAISFELTDVSRMQENTQHRLQEYKAKGTAPIDAVPTNDYS